MHHNSSHVSIQPSTEHPGRYALTAELWLPQSIERVFPLFTPSIERIEVLRSGKVKRAKLYYLRTKVGKHATKIESAKGNS